MSESFLIKKTAFSDTATITEKREKSFSIAPGELNGPGGITRDTDLKIYGFGSAKWGEGVNQNLVRMLENNACLPKEDGDYNPTTGLFNYLVSSDPLLPKDEFDLGIGNGITNPTLGQNWFNLATGLMNVYSFSFVGSPPVQTIGWTSGVETGIFITTIDMSGNVITGLGNPLDADDAINLGYADNRYVNVTGDTMTGDLDFSGAEVTGLPAIPTSLSSAISNDYAQNTYLPFSGGTLTGDLQFVLDVPSGSVTAIHWSGNTDFAKIFAQGYAGGEDSQLVFQVGDNTAGGNDHFLFQTFEGAAPTDVFRIAANEITSFTDFIINESDFHINATQGNYDLDITNTDFNDWTIALTDGANNGSTELTFDVNKVIFTNEVRISDDQGIFFGNVALNDASIKWNSFNNYLGIDVPTGEIRILDSGSLRITIDPSASTVDFTDCDLTTTGTFNAGIATINGTISCNTPTAINHATTKAYVDGLVSTPGFTAYVSAEQAISPGSQLVLAHGLGTIPAIIQYHIICKVAEHGYSVGDLLLVGDGAQHYTVSTTGYGMATTVNSANIIIRYASESTDGFLILNKNSGVAIGNGFTNNNWRLIVKAWA